MRRPPRFASSPRLLALLLGLAPVPAALAAQAPEGAPAWLTEQMTTMVTGDSLRWLTDNCRWQGPDEPFSAYGTRFWWGPGRLSLRGVLFAIRDGRETQPIWSFSLFWHPGERKVLLTQVGFHGVYGAGEMRRRPDGSFETTQLFWSPDGTRSEIRHEDRFEGGTRHIGQSANLVNGEWKPGRSYTWIKEPSPDPDPRSD